ncbi:MAG: hypothetical protein DRH50_09075 [Deltaproteobacteria bacterium]|nr:MAG: hypothetical protein DRH50_09075 [Deltaproteobacteria bacterium]
MAASFLFSLSLPHFPVGVDVRNRCLRVNGKVVAAQFSIQHQHALVEAEVEHTVKAPFDAH